MIFFSLQNKPLGRSAHNTVLKFLIPYHTPNIVILLLFFYFCFYFLRSSFVP